MTVLTVDFGTSAIKVGLWSDAALVALTRAPIETRHPAPGYAEQDPDAWWRATADAAAAARAAAPEVYSRVGVVAAATARETFACVDDDLRPLGDAILWSDARARDEVATLGDAAGFRARTGVQATAGCCAAKIAWLRAHDRDRFRDAAWLLGPRDLVFARLTGRVVTDPTVASRTGLYSLDGAYLGDDALADRLPAVVSSVVAQPMAHAALLDLPADVVGVLGAGDRACEAVGVAAAPDVPMLSFGTTANVSVPHAGPASALPSVAQVSRTVDGYLVEAGLSTAGAALEWLGSLTGRTRDELLAGAAAIAPGAGGLLAFPWLQGARAPWWHPEARAVFSGVTSAHGPAELARALLEGIALDAARSVELVSPAATAVALAGAGAREPTWAAMVSALTGRTVVRRRLDDAASAGARLLAADDSVPVDEVNPVAGVDAPDPTLVEAYRPVRAASDALAARLLDLG